MIKINKNYLWCIFLLLSASCADQWDEHSGVPSDLEHSLLQLMEEDSDLSTFAGWVKSSGVVQQMEANKSYTVWAPSNQALQNVPESITGNEEALRLFVANHIGYQEHLTHDAEAGVRVKMLNGKVTVLTENAITAVDESAGFEYANRLAKNGVLYKVDNFLTPKKNVWEILQEESSSAVSQFIHDMSVTDSATGETYNYFQMDVADLSNEDSTYTFIMLTDEAFGNFQVEMAPYFKDTLPEDVITQPHAKGLTKDLVFTEAYYDNVPDTIVSLDTVKVAFNPDNVVRQINASNGVVYVMDAYDFKWSDKIPDIKIEGEYFDAVSGDRNRVNIRARSWASNGRDVMARDHSTPSFHITYRVPQAHSTKYKVYWRAVNDGYIPRSNWQRVAMDSVQNSLFGNREVVPNTFEEVLLGEHEVQNYGQLSLVLTSETTSNNDWNTLVLDYFRLVPVFDEDEEDEEE